MSRTVTFCPLPRWPLKPQSPHTHSSPRNYCAESLAQLLGGGCLGTRMAVYALFLGPTYPLGCWEEGWETRLLSSFQIPRATSQGNLWKQLCSQPGRASTPLPPTRAWLELREVWRMGEEKEERIGSRAPRSGLPSRWRLHITACLAPLSTRLPSQGSRQLKKDKIKRSNSPALTSARGLNSPAAA